MALYELTDNAFQSIEPTTFSAHQVKERADLQRLLRQQIEIIDPDVLVIDEEFSDWIDSQRRIDLLGVDRTGCLVVFELKRSQSGGHMELQALRYAAMVSAMTFGRAVQVFASYLQTLEMEGDAEEMLLKHLKWGEPNEDKFGKDVRIVLVSADFSKELTSAVLWLNERQLDIRCVRLSPYQDGNRLLVDVQQVIPLPEAEEFQVKLKEKTQRARQDRLARAAWTGVYFVNIGMDGPHIPRTDGRHWENCRRHGYVTAGGGAQWSTQLKKLRPGNVIAAYAKKCGYVGIGEVVDIARPVHELSSHGYGALEQALRGFFDNTENEEPKWAWAAVVKWIKSVENLEDAKWFKGAFAIPAVVCKLRDPETLKFLSKKFNIDLARDTSK